MAENELIPSIAILAGGRATRMHGQDKGLVCFRGQPLVMHLYWQIAQQSDDILINANRNHAIYQQLLPTCPIIIDQWTDFKGPLAGIHTALLHAKRDYILIIPCDLLLLPANCISKLWRAMQNANSRIAYARLNGRALYPLCLLHASLRHSLEQTLATGQHAVRHWLMAQHAASADFLVDNILPPNLNTPEDVALAEQCYASEISIFSALLNSGVQQ